MKICFITLPDVHGHRNVKRRHSSFEIYEKIIGSVKFNLNENTLNWSSAAIYPLDSFLLLLASKVFDRLLPMNELTHFSESTIIIFSSQTFFLSIYSNVPKYI